MQVVAETFSGRVASVVQRFLYELATPLNPRAAIEGGPRIVDEEIGRTMLLRCVLWTVCGTQGTGSQNSAHVSVRVEAKNRRK